MPYLNKNFESEAKIHTCAKRATGYSSSLSPQNYAGFLNWRNFYDVRVYLKRNPKINRYWVFALITGTMFLCILEIWRRIIVPYEDKKIAENGDVTAED